MRIDLRMVRDLPQRQSVSHHRDESSYGETLASESFVEKCEKSPSRSAQPRGRCAAVRVRAEGYAYGK
eukprot:2156300-Prymnesium_polylepis.1